ncbi:MAG: TonB-dependent receptor [Gammaproteobacteria bacterium]|nr:TonB-dependent receptor [Gammaproteobacteria bacterium]
MEGTANTFADLTTHGASFKIKWQFSDDWYLESITAYRKLSWDFILDADSTPFPVLDIPVYEDDDQFSTELRFALERDSGLSFTGGVYLFNDDDVVLAGFDDASASFQFLGFFFPIISVGVPSGGYGESDQRTRSMAVFADITFPITDTTSFEIGARYTNDEKEVTRRGEFFFDPTLSLSLDRPPFLSGVGFPGENLQDEQDWSAVTPRAVLSYQPNDGLTAYGSVSRGFKSGGFPGRAFASSEFKPFDPETVWTYEAGVKGRGPDNRFTWSAAYFYNDYKDLQLNGFGQDPETGQFVSLFTNAASAKIHGVEGVVSYRPNDRLSIDASVGYLNAEYEEFEILVLGMLTDVSDRRLPNAPEWTGFLGMTWSDQLTANLAATVHVDIAYKGGHANESTDSPNLAVPAATYINAFVSISGDDERWEVRLGGTNLTDRARAAQSFNTAEFSGVETAFMGMPHLYDIRLLWRFD